MNITKLVSYFGDLMNTPDLQKLAEENTQLKKQISELKEQLNEEKHDQLILSEDNNCLQRKLRNTVDDKQEMERVVGELRNELDELRKENNEMRIQDIEFKNDVVAEINSENKTLKDTVERLKAGFDDLSLFNENQDLRKKNAFLRKEIEELEQIDVKNRRLLFTLEKIQIILNGFFFCYSFFFIHFFFQLQVLVLDTQ
jgi:chromosome segregation ATPase